MRSRLLPTLLLIAAQAIASETVDNNAVVRLVKTGLSAEVIILKIEQSEGRFDVSTDGLIALKTGVPDAVIKAMLLKAPAAPAAPPPVPPVAQLVAPAAARCASVRYFTSGNEGWNWYPANLCVTASAIVIDEQNIPFEQIVAHCAPRATLLNFGGTAYRGMEEWWFTDGRELHKFRGKTEEIDALVSAVVRAHPSSRHGSCADRDLQKLLPRK